MPVSGKYARNKHARIGSNIGIPCNSDVVEAEIASATATDTEAVVVVVCCSALIADAVRSKTNN